jgi:hypothetical protein
MQVSESHNIIVEIEIGGKVFDFQRAYRFDRLHLVDQQAYGVVAYLKICDFRIETVQQEMMIVQAVVDGVLGKIVKPDSGICKDYVTDQKIPFSRLISGIQPVLNTFDKFSQVDLFLQGVLGQVYVRPGKGGMIDVDPVFRYQCGDIEINQQVIDPNHEILPTVQNANLAQLQFVKPIQVNAFNRYGKLYAITYRFGEFLNHFGLDEGNLDGRRKKQEKDKNPYDNPEYSFDHRIFNKFEI